MPSAAPSASDPTSPMKISAGYELYQRNPSDAPTSDAAEHRQLRRLRKAHQQQVVGEHAVAGDVRQRGVRRRGDREDADRQTVEAVGQVDGVRLGDQHEHRERQVPPAEIRNQPLEERKDQPRVVDALLLRARAARRRPRAPISDLAAHLVARQQAVVRAADDLQVVVGNPIAPKPAVVSTAIHT